MYVTLKIFLVYDLLTESEFNEFEPRLKSTKNRCQLSVGLNLETLNTILIGTKVIWAAFQILATAQIL